MSFLSKLREIAWGKPAATRAERTLIVKLDFVILSFCCLMYWVNYLDRMNLNNAYVSGMKEDLGFKGKELNVINTSRSPMHLTCVQYLTDIEQSSTAATSWGKSRATSRCRSSPHASSSPAASLHGVC